MDFYKPIKSQYFSFALYALTADDKQIMTRYFRGLLYPRNFDIDHKGKLCFNSDGFLNLFSDNGYVEDHYYKNMKASAWLTLNMSY